MLRHVARERRGQIIAQAHPLLVLVLEREDAGVRAVLVGKEFAERVGILDRGRLHRLEAIALVDRADGLEHPPRGRDLRRTTIREPARQARFELVGLVGHGAASSAFRLDRIGMRSPFLCLRMPLSENRRPLFRDMR